MDVFLMIRRKKTTLFLDAKENTMVAELKKMVEGITKVPPSQQRLYKDNAVSIVQYRPFLSSFSVVDCWCSSAYGTALFPLVLIFGQSVSFYHIEQRRCCLLSFIFLQFFFSIVV